MKESQYTTTVIRPEEGHFLTQAADVPLADRVVSSSVYLAAGSTPADWREITSEEADEINRLKDEARKAELDAALQPNEEAE